MWLDFDEFGQGEDFFFYGATPTGSGTINGVVFPDRTIQPEIWQLKKSQEPVFVEAIDLESVKVRISNRYSFTNLSDIDAGWSLHTGEKLIDSGKLKLDVAPRSAAEVQLPKMPVECSVEHSGCRLLLEFKTTVARPGLPVGHEVAFAQFELPRDKPDQMFVDPIRSSLMPVLALRDSPGAAVITGKNFTYRFDRRTGTFSSMNHAGKELLAAGPRLSFWRAPISHETSTWGEAEAEKWYALGFDRVEHIVDKVEIRQLTGQIIRIQVEADVRAPGSWTGYRSVYDYRVFGSGDIILRHHATPFGDPPWLPKFGLTLEMPAGFDKLAWFGRGPFETYPDRKTGARIGVFRSTVAQEYVPYIVPQDHGNKTDVRWAMVTDGSRAGLAFFPEETMNFSVHSFENLDRAVFTYQLERKKTLTVNLDHVVSGVGDTATGTQPAYRTFPREYDYSIRIRPVTGDDPGPSELVREYIVDCTLPLVRCAP